MSTSEKTRPPTKLPTSAAQDADPSEAIQQQHQQQQQQPSQQSAIIPKRLQSAERSEGNPCPDQHQTNPQNTPHLTDTAKPKKPKQVTARSRSNRRVRAAKRETTPVGELSREEIECLEEMAELARMQEYLDRKAEELERKIAVMNSRTTLSMRK